MTIIEETAINTARPNTTVVVNSIILIPHIICYPHTQKGYTIQNR